MNPKVIFASSALLATLAGVGWHYRPAAQPVNSSQSTPAITEDLGQGRTQAFVEPAIPVHQARFHAEDQVVGSSSDAYRYQPVAYIASQSGICNCPCPTVVSRRAVHTRRYRAASTRRIAQANTHPDTYARESDYYRHERVVPALQRTEYTTTRTTYRTDDREYDVVKKRSKKKSLAIVAGSAGAGAAIGALIDGGEGAGIGALIGGGSGFVYDRLTRHHHREY